MDYQLNPCFGCKCCKKSEYNYAYICYLCGKSPLCWICCEQHVIDQQYRKLCRNCKIDNDANYRDNISKLKTLS